MADVAVSGDMDDQMSDMRSKNEEKAIVSSTDNLNLKLFIAIWFQCWERKSYWRKAEARYKSCL
mgnify:CR=1 FL=1